MRSCFSSSRSKVYNFYHSFTWQWGQYCKLISSIRPKGNTLSREYLVKEESLHTALARVELKVYHLYLRCISLGGEYGDWFRSSRPKMYHFYLRGSGHGGEQSEWFRSSRAKPSYFSAGKCRIEWTVPVIRKLPTRLRDLYGKEITTRKTHISDISNRRPETQHS
jgi:hypothetical protein